MRSLSFAIFFLVSGATQAGSITYYLENFTFGDGGIATGSFVFDTATDTFSSIDIRTTAGTKVSPGFSYNDTNLLADRSTELNLWLTETGEYNTAGYKLRLQFLVSLDNGEVVGTLQNREVIAGMSETRYTGSGAFVTTVPLPAAVWLFGSAIVGLRWIRRKQTA